MGAGFCPLAFTDHTSLVSPHIISLFPRRIPMLTLAFAKRSKFFGLIGLLSVAKRLRSRVAISAFSAAFGFLALSTGVLCADASPMHIVKTVQDVHIDATFRASGNVVKGDMKVTVKGLPISEDLFNDAWGNERKATTALIFKYNKDDLIQVVTLKGAPEPIIVILEKQCGGSCTSQSHVYVYSINDGKPHYTPAPVALYKTLAEIMSVKPTTFKTGIVLESRRVIGCDTYATSIDFGESRTVVAVRYDQWLCVPRAGRFPRPGDKIRIAHGVGPIYATKSQLVAEFYGAGPGDVLTGTPVRTSSRGHETSPRMLVFARRSLSDGHDNVWDAEFQDTTGTRRSYMVVADSSSHRILEESIKLRATPLSFAPAKIREYCESHFVQTFFPDAYFDSTMATVVVDGDPWIGLRGMMFGYEYSYSYGTCSIVTLQQFNKDLAGIGNPHD
jgi:hypothetical protein